MAKTYVADNLDWLFVQLLKRGAFLILLVAINLAYNGMLGPILSLRLKDINHSWYTWHRWYYAFTMLLLSLLSALTISNNMVNNEGPVVLLVLNYLAVIVTLCINSLCVRAAIKKDINKIIKEYFRKKA